MRGEWIWTSQAAERPTFTDWVAFFISEPLRFFRWRVMVTPKLRERCVDYALRARGGNVTDAWSLTSEAAKIAEYIAKGKL